MAGSSDDQRRRRADDMLHGDLEEGEFVPGRAGYHSESDTEEYYNHYSSSDSDDDGEATSRTRWLFVATSNGESSCSSSVAANNSYEAGASSSFAAAPSALTCRVCGKEFTSSKAMCGHMKVHALEQGTGKEEVKRTVSLATMGWGGTGKRGCSGARSSGSVSPKSEPENATAVVVAAEPKIVLEPMPLAYAATNLSSSVPVASEETENSGEASNAQTTRDDAMAIVVAGSAPPPPPTEAIVHHQAAPLRPPLAAAAERQAPPAIHRQRAAAPAAGLQNPGGYPCAECGMWFRTHQALGGHATGHRNRRVAAAAAGARQQVGAAPCRGGGAKQERLHPCEECSAVFATGVQLGGHMRKHWKGEPIRPRKKQRLTQLPLLLPPPPEDRTVPRPDPVDDDVTQLRLGLSFEADVQSPAPAVERVQPAPAPAPAPAEGTVEAVQAAAETPATRRVILFGVDIGPSVKGPRTREGSPATEDSADVGGQQQ